MMMNKLSKMNGSAGPDEEDPLSEQDEMAAMKAVIEDMGRVAKKHKANKLMKKPEAMKMVEVSEAPAGEGLEAGADDESGELGDGDLAGKISPEDIMKLKAMLEGDEEKVA